VEVGARNRSCLVVFGPSSSAAAESGRDAPARAQRPTARIDARARGTRDGLTVRVDPSGTQTTPSSGTSKPLFGVWGSDASDVWAVGLDATIIHWQGTSWTASPSSVGTYTSLHSVSGNASDDVWSVGDSGTIVHWDGTAWSTVPSGTTLDLEGVWADGADDVWAIGLRVAVGASWRPNDP
jgi:hypothetical protein